MAKLRKLTIEVSLMETRKKYHYDAHMEYNPGQEIFFIRVPDDQKQFQPEDEETKILVGHANIRGMGGESTKVFSAKLEQDVITKATAYFKAFLTAVRSHRKVILYKFNYRTEGLIKDRGRIGSMMARTQVLEFVFIMCEENTVGSKKTYLRRYMHESIGFDDGKREMTESLDGLVGDYSNKWLIMDWTEEREQFFENLKAGMHQMIEQVDSFVSDNETFAALIDQGKNLLTTGEEG